MTAERFPNFMIIGAMKSGTTSLYRYLSDHPQIFMSETKELDFFVAEKNWPLGPEWYAANFADAGDAVAVGEASTNYSKHPAFAGVPQRIASMLPDVRLIYVVRHPIERMRSQYLMMFDREREPFEHALLRNPHYLNLSRYAMQIERYLERFPREQLLVIPSEDLLTNRRETLRKVHVFLGVDPSLVPPSVDTEFYRSSEWKIRNPLAWKVRSIPGSYRVYHVLPEGVKRVYRRVAVKDVSRIDATIRDELRSRLEDALRDDVRRLYAYMDAGFDGWGIA